METMIEKVYRETAGALNDIYSKRKRTLTYQKLMWGVTGAFFGLMLLGMVTVNLPFLKFDFLKGFASAYTSPYASVYPLVGLIVVLYPTTYFFSKSFQKFKEQENKTIASMVKRLFPKVDFAQNTKAPLGEVVQSKLFAWTKEDSAIYSYGQIRSRTNNLEINIIDIGIVEQNVSKTLTGTLMHIPVLNLLVVGYQNVLKNMVSKTSAEAMQYTFRGMFCWLRFKKKLKGHTVVLPYGQSTKLDRWASFNFKEEQRVQLEDPRFSQRFAVYGTDQVEARYVLSAALMERIVSLREKFDRPMFLSFQDRQLYLAVQNKNGLFSFPSGKLDRIKIVEELAHDIQTALDISLDLKIT